MNQPPILKVAINVPLSREFDYLPPGDNPSVAPGCRVHVPFGARRQVGLVVGSSHASTIPANKLRACTDVLDASPLLRAEDLWLIRFTARYYHHPIGEVVAAALPALLRQGKELHAQAEVIALTATGECADIEVIAKRAPKQAMLLAALADAGGDGLSADILNEQLPNWRRSASALLKKNQIEKRLVRTTGFGITGFGITDFDSDTLVPASTAPTLNTDQVAALETLRESDDFSVSVLDGVTGSGKTEVYLQRMQDFIGRGKQVMVLVPEIGLTPQLVGRLRARLSLQPALLHSGLTDHERLAAWRAARDGSAQLVIGTRSAVFTPLQNPGLIVIDEEHDPSFKQQEGLRYSARDLAIARAKHLSIPIILGSATPTLEVLFQCQQENYRRIVLPVRAGSASPPAVRIIDTVRTPTTDGISEPLAQSISRHLNAAGQVLIFLNRRGFAPTLICASCGHVANCTRCDSRLTVHAKRQQLRCHHCGSMRPLVTDCDECGEPVKPLGEGTERLEESLSLRYPDKRITRIDSDTTQRKGAMDEALQLATSGSADILVGTQMLSKGHHFPKLSLVGIVNADQGLFGTDFRSAERLAQSITQVAGRAGRESDAGEVLIQTAFPDNPFWQSLLDGGYAKIAEIAMAERQTTRWPPFSRLVLIRSSAPRAADAHRFLSRAQHLIEARECKKLKLLGPVDAPMARRAGRYRAQLLLQSADRASLHALLGELRLALEADESARRVRWSIDVDPLDLF